MTLSRHILVLSLMAIFAMGTLIPSGYARAQEEQQNAQEQQEEALDEQQWQGITTNECYNKCGQRHEKWYRRCLKKAAKKESQKAELKCRTKRGRKVQRCRRKRCVKHDPR